MEKNSVFDSQGKIDRERWEKEAQKIITNIESNFLTKEGFLARNYPAGERTLFDNLDDIAPFFIYFSRDDFLLEQLRLIARKKVHYLNFLKENDTITTRNIDEWLGGIYAVFEKTKDEMVFNLTEQTLDFIKSNLIKDNFLTGAYYLNTYKEAGFWESWSAGLLEVFLEMKKDFKELGSQAEKIMRVWIDSEYFRQYGLFPYRVFRNPGINWLQKNLLANRLPVSSSRPPASYSGGLAFWKNRLAAAKNALNNGWYSQLMKSNTTPAFCLLELARTTQEKLWLEALERWLKSALANFTHEGQVFREYIPKKNLKRLEGTVPAFALMDVICDAAHFYPQTFKKYLPRAREIANFQLTKKRADGLIRETAGKDLAHLDSQIDLGVSLRRLGELTGDDQLKEEGALLTARALKIHASPEGLLTYSPKTANNVIDPKYNALALKGIINLLTLEDSLYARHSLFKDR